jgi:hypothetical protein
MARKNASAEVGHLLTGELVIDPASLDSAKFVTREVALSKSVGSIFFSGPGSAITKTLGPFNGQINWNDGSGVIALLHDARITVTRMTNPGSGVSFLMLSLEYLLTSRGARTGDGRSLPNPPGSYGNREPYGCDHAVYFRNAQGGTMYTWGMNPYVGTLFHLKCGDNRRYVLHSKAENNFISWFDAWTGYQHLVSGAFFRC